MRVPDALRDCVCFLQARWSGSPGEVRGTAFFVGVGGDFARPSWIYAVTAKHVFLHDENGRLADEIALIVNTDAGIQAIQTNPSDWKQHPTSDVAILSIRLTPGVHRAKVYPVESVATADFVQARNVGAGDDVFVTGLLVHHPGTTRIMPIVRLGCIAGLPDDPVKLRTGEDIVGLLEVRSIGGISGSPVFLHLPFWRDVPPGKALMSGKEGITAGSGGREWLLGVMHGFYPVGKNDPDGVSQGNENLNTGIAVVVLVDRILDLINHPIEVEARERVEAEREQSQMPKPAATTVDQRSEFERFEALTGKLINVPKKELDEKRKDES